MCHKEINKIELLPCPFCGGKAELIDSNNCDLYYFVPYYVRCKNLCYEDFEEDKNILPLTDDYSTKEEAIEAWNNRAFDW